jgi:hypothetical protein
MSRMEARSCPSTYIVFLSMFGALAGLGFAVGLRRHDWVGFWVSLVPLFFSIAWIASFQLKIDDHALEYRSLFGGRKSIALLEIAKAEVKTGPENSFGPFYRLTIYPQHELRLRPIVINLKVFSREDLKQLYKILGDKLK